MIVVNNVHQKIIQTCKFGDHFCHLRERELYHYDNEEVEVEGQNNTYLKR